MDHIKIVFSKDTILDNTLFNIHVNDVGVGHAVNENQIHIRTDAVGWGVNNLSIKVLSELNQKTLKIEEFWLNGAHGRQTVYLSYSELNGKKFNNTFLKQSITEINIPFGNPMSWWITSCNKKVDINNYGKDLYEDNFIYYPASREIDSKFPRAQRDFFKYDFDWRIAPKSHMKNLEQTRTIPYFELGLEYDEDSLYQELDRNLDLLDQHKLPKPKQEEYNQIEYPGNDWDVYACIFPKEKTGSTNWKDNFCLAKDQFPGVYELLEKIDQLGITISYGFISRTAGESYVGPHIHKDSEFNYSVYQVSIPLGWTEQSLFKLEGVGVIPTDRCVVFDDCSNFHATVNPTHKTRYIIGINCDFTKYFS